MPKPDKPKKHRSHRFDPLRNAVESFAARKNKAKKDSSSSSTYEASGTLRIPLERQPTERLQRARSVSPADISRPVYHPPLEVTNETFSNPRQPPPVPIVRVQLPAASTPVPFAPYINRYDQQHDEPSFSATASSFTSTECRQERRDLDDFGATLPLPPTRPLRLPNRNAVVTVTPPTPPSAAETSIASVATYRSSRRNCRREGILMDDFKLPTEETMPATPRQSRRRRFPKPVPYQRSLPAGRLYYEPYRFEK